MPNEVFLSNEKAITFEFINCHQHIDRETDRQTDIDRQTKTDRQTGRETDRQTGRQIDR